MTLDLSSMEAPKSLVGQTLAERFKLRARLGQGPLGLTYLAQDEQEKGNCAVKVIRPEWLTADGIVDRINEALETAQQLEHKAAVPIRSFGPAGDDGYFVAMNMVTGQSLTRFLVKHTKISSEMAGEIGKQLLELLFEAHQSGVAHGGIKPSNIIVEFRGETPTGYLTDFGLVAPIQQAGLMQGNPYTSPELLQGNEPSPAADIYSLSAVLYHAISGKAPFGEKTGEELLAAIQAGEPQSVREAGGGDAVPPALDVAIMRGLSADPDARYDSAATYHEYLTAAMGGPESDLRSRPAPRSAVPRTRPENSTARPGTKILVEEQGGGRAAEDVSEAVSQALAQTEQSWKEPQSADAPPPEVGAEAAADPAAADAQSPEPAAEMPGTEMPAEDEMGAHTLEGVIVDGIYEMKQCLSGDAVCAEYLAVDDEEQECFVVVLHPGDEQADAVATAVEANLMLNEQVAHEQMAAPQSTGRTGDGMFYIVYNVPPGDNLQAALAEHGMLPPPVAVPIATQLVDLLDTAHQAGHAHGALRATRVFVDVQDGSPQTFALGFGLLAVEEAARGCVVGDEKPDRLSPYGLRYIAPEQIRGDTQVRSDVYSLAVLTFEMVSGQTPFDDDDVETLKRLVTQHTPPSLRQVRPDLGLPTELNMTLARGLGKRPEERYGDYHEFSSDLVQSLSGRVAKLEPQPEAPAEPARVSPPPQAAPAPEAPQISEPPAPSPQPEPERQPAASAPTQIGPPVDQVPVDTPTPRRPRQPGSSVAIPPRTPPAMAAASERRTGRLPKRKPKKSGGSNVLMVVVVLLLLLGGATGFYFVVMVPQQRQKAALKQFNEKVANADYAGARELLPKLPEDKLAWAKAQLELPKKLEAAEELVKQDQLLEARTPLDDAKKLLKHASDTENARWEELNKRVRIAELRQQVANTEDSATIVSKGEELLALLKETGEAVPQDLLSKIDTHRAQQKFDQLRKAMEADKVDRMLALADEVESLSLEGPLAAQRMRLLQSVYQKGFAAKVAQAEKAAKAKQQKDLTQALNQLREMSQDQEERLAQVKALESKLEQIRRQEQDLYDRLQVQLEENGKMPIEALALSKEYVETFSQGRHVAEVQSTLDDLQQKMAALEGIFITTEPSGATVAINDREFGTTPLFVDAGEAGLDRGMPFTMLLRREYYSDKTVEITYKGGAQEEHSEMVAKNRELRLRVKDEGGKPLASVQVSILRDGEEIDVVTTEADGEKVVSLPVGKYVFKATAEGYQPATHEDMLTDAQAGALPVEMQLMPQPSTIKIVSDQPGLTVQVRGDEVQEVKTAADPVVLENLEPGDYEVEITLPNGAVYTRTVSVGTGDETLVELKTDVLAREEEQAFKHIMPESLPGLNAEGLKQVYEDMVAFLEEYPKGNFRNRAGNVVAFAAYRLGGQHLRSKEYGEAAEMLEAGLKYVSNDTYRKGLLRLLHQAHMSQENWAAASETVEELLKHAPADKRYQLHQARVLVELEKDEQALKAVNKFLAQWPESAEAHRLRSRLYERRGEMSRALRELMVAARQEPTVESVLAVARGHTRAARKSTGAEREQMLKIADSFYDKLAEMMPEADLAPETAAAYHHERAEFLMELADEPAKAVEAMDKATTLHPDNWRYWLFKARAQIAAGQTQPALASLNKARQESDGKQTPLIQTYVGQVHMANNNWDEALKAFRIAVGLDSSLAEGHGGLGRCYEKLNQHSEARKAYKEAQRLDPGNPEWCEALGRVWRKEGQTDQAKYWSDRAEQLRNRQ